MEVLGQVSYLFTPPLETMAVPCWEGLPLSPAVLHLSAKNMTNDTVEEERIHSSSGFARPKPDWLRLAFHEQGAKFLENDLIVGEISK